MEWYWILVFFIFGTVFGSFFNVVGLRVPKNRSFNQDRSFCPQCEQQLRWFELIPLVSFIIQKGKCRRCQFRISIMYPLIELVTGILFAFSYFELGFSLELITALLLISMLVTIFVTDINYMLIPNKILLFFLPFLLVMRVLSPLDPWYNALIGAVIGFVLLAAIIFVSKGGMGGGDMKLFAILGFLLGWKGMLLTLFLASFLGALIGGTLMFIQKRGRKQPIPFGPYIVVAALITYFYETPLISAYLSLF